MDNKLIIAHRGASKDAPENTLAAFQKAIELGADMIELDARKTKDNIMVVIHDPKIGQQHIKDLTYQEITKLNPAIPTLKEALMFISGKAPVQIEIKEEGYERQIAELAMAYFKPADFIVISFIFKSLKEIKTQFPQVKTGLILGSTTRRLRQVLTYLLYWPNVLRFADLIAINWKLWRWGFKMMIPKNHPMVVWTVDEPELISALLKDKRVWGITTNNPKVGVRLRNQMSLLTPG